MSFTQAPAFDSPWFAPGVDAASVSDAGLRLTGGGGHQSKTLMLNELAALLSEAESRGLAAAINAVSAENLLGKPSGAAGESVLANLTKLYGIKAPPPITRALIRLWALDATPRPMLALLCALARDPLLRDTGSVVLQGSVGNPALLVDEDGLGQGMAGLALVEPGLAPPAQLRTLQPVEGE